MATFYHLHATLEYIGLSTGHIFVELISGVTTSSSEDLLTPLSHLQNIVLWCFSIPDLKFIKIEYSLRLKIKRNDWLLADTCPQAANHCALFSRPEPGTAALEGYA